MPDSSQEALLSSQINTLVVFGLVGFFLNWIAWYNGFYKLPPEKPSDAPQVTFLQLISVFGMYLGILFFGGLFLPRPLQNFATISEFSAGVAQLILSSFVLCSLLIFCKSQDRVTMRKIWKNPNNPSSLFKDLGLGSIVWFFSYPLVTVIGSLCDIVVEHVLHLVSHEQNVVQYLKGAFASPPLLIVLLILILILAPIIEEILFRGFLQNFLKKHLGRKAAILLASFCFAFFHYSQNQEGGNISLIISLFCFSLFLGFIYERQRSLLANIALHATFNLGTTIMIALEL